MTDQHVSYPSDDGPEDGVVPTLHILRDDQGDFYVSVGGRKPGWTCVRLCGPNGGGAATKLPDFYDAISMAAWALAGDRERVLAVARRILHTELGELRRELGRERSAKERAEAERNDARRAQRRAYRRHVEQRALLVGGTAAWCPVCEVIVEPIRDRATQTRCCSGHELVFAEDWKARAEATERELAQLKAEQGGGDPYDDPSYQAYVDSCAKNCRCDLQVCPGVLAGGLCDSWDGSPGGFDDTLDDSDFDDQDESEGWT